MNGDNGDNQEHTEQPMYYIKDAELYIIAFISSRCMQKSSCSDNRYWYKSSFQR